MKREYIRKLAVLLAVLCVLAGCTHAAVSPESGAGTNRTAAEGQYEQAVYASYRYAGSPYEEVNGNRPFLRRRS